MKKRIRRILKQHDFQLAYILIGLGILSYLLHPHDMTLISLEILCSLDVLALLFLGCDSINLILLGCVIFSYLSLRITSEAWFLIINYLLMGVVVPIYVWLQDRNFFQQKKLS